jgi:hypothetical protein
VSAISWQQTPDRRVWRAARGRLVLTVTKVSNGMFRADIEGTTTAHSPEFAKRTSAQRWAEQHAGGVQ